MFTSGGLGGGYIGDVIQKTLFDELEEVSKTTSHANKPLILTKNDLVSSGEGIIFPCVVARRLPITQRPGHISNCGVCKRLERELDESIGVVGKNVWYE